MGNEPFLSCKTSFRVSDQFSRPALKRPMRELDRRPLPPRPMQRRMRPELKQHIEPKTAKPAHKVDKAEPKLVKAQSKVVKVEAKVKKVEAKAVNPEKKKIEDGKAGSEEKAKKAPSKLKQPPSKPPRAEPNADGYFELNPLMARALDSELQDIMIKVRQGLSDESPSDAEKLVADKFRTEAGNHLKNVIGLNITKRLLNVFNPLFVKVEFNRKPEEIYLKKFVRACNCVAMKKFRSNDCTYVAQIRSVADYDRICGVKRLRCGEARATVVPCYRFTQCPPKLKTIYNIENVQDRKHSSETNKGVEQTEKNHTENLPSVPTTNEKTSQIKKRGGKEEIKLDPTNTVKNKNTSKEDVNVTCAANKMDTAEKSVTASTPNKSDVAIKPNAVKNSNEKPITTKSVAVGTTKKSDVANKPDVVKNSKEKPIVSKPVPADTANKSDVANITAVAKKPEAVKNSSDVPVASKPDLGNKPVKISDEETIASKPSPASTTNKSDVAKKLDTTKVSNEKLIASKHAIKSNTTVKNKKIPVQNTEQKPLNDYDELDDEDILNLISEGIILDECSGSDNE